jgi:hypothetical protein
MSFLPEKYSFDQCEKKLNNSNMTEYFYYITDLSASNTGIVVAILFDS